MEHHHKQQQQQQQQEKQQLQQPRYRQRCIWLFLFFSTQ
jgi:uncharacterized membrane protein